jgi:hypothetical protein
LKSNDPRQRVVDAIREKLFRAILLKSTTPVTAPERRGDWLFPQLVAALGELERECDDTYGCSGRGHVVLGRINLYLDPDPHERCNGTGFILNDELDHLSESNPERVAADVRFQLERIAVMFEAPILESKGWKLGIVPMSIDDIADAIVAKVQAGNRDEQTGA